MGFNSGFKGLTVVRNYAFKHPYGYFKFECLTFLFFPFLFFSFSLFGFKLKSLVMELNRKCDSALIASIRGAANLCVMLVNLYESDLSEDQIDLTVPNVKALYY